MYLKNELNLAKNDLLTSFLVIGRKNDWINNYVSKLAQNILVGSQIYLEI
jgi:hypothetical protein